MTAKKLVVWDLDDTLMDNVHDYAQPILDSMSVIVRELGRRAPHVSALMQIEQKIDKDRIERINPDTGEKFLFSMERFPGSLVKTYQYVCAEVGATSDRVVEEELWEIGMQAFDPSRYEDNILPEAESVLKAVAEMGSIQVLLTKGDPRVQDPKFKALQAQGLLKYFAFYEPVPKKGVEEFSDALKKAFSYGPVGHLRVSIGNGWKSDIEPAIEAGYIGILVPTWNWEEIHDKDKFFAEAEAHESVVIAETLAEVPAIVEAL